MGMEVNQSSLENPGKSPGAVLAFPASLAQQAFWFLDQLAPGISAFNVAVRFHLAGPLDPTLVRRAINEILRRHEILRTGFEDAKGELMQVIQPSVEIEVPVTDVSQLPDSERKAEVERLGSAEAEAVFDLKRAPLFRANLLRLGSGEHILQITVHHAVSDGWSIGLMTDELAALYDAFSRGEPSPLPELPIQFADYSMWQQEYLRGPEIASQIEYWKRRLKDYVELFLPTDSVRPAVKSWKGDIVSLLLPQDLTDRLKGIARQNGATLSMLFCAAFKVLLARYTGQTDISIGTSIAGRTSAELEKLIGVFINTVILRSDLSGNPPFSRILRSERDTFLEAMENQEVPFELLVKELTPERDPGRNPLFQVNFTHQRDFVKPVTFGKVQLTAVPSRPTGAIFDLHLFMVERDDVWRASCDFNDGLIHRDTAIRMLAHFRELLGSVADNPETPLDALQILPDEEQRRILTEWNATDREFPGTQTVGALFEQQVRAHPDRIAVRCGDEVLTYGELDRRADLLARRLRAARVARGSLVGLCVERSGALIVGLLGILKTGAAYVPMDPAFPTERLGYMVEDAALPVIVTQPSLVAHLPQHRAEVMMIDGGVTGAVPGSDWQPATGDDIAYVIFTSGSTGRPKGVQVTHRSLVNFLNSMRREPGLKPDDVVLSVTTLSFDIAGLEIFLPLTTGATMVIATREIATDALMLARELERTAATVLQATPITWRMLLESGWKGSSRLKCLVGGEAVPRDLVNQLAPKCASLWNMYGPTETTIWSTVGKLEAGDGPVCIGRPIDNTTVYVVSPAMQLQPIGVPGELLIGGEGVAVGYLKRPELTAEKFIADPFSKQSGARLYRTGDLARWRSDGTLECLGRIDHQVKIRGFRIELGEIESVLGRHPAVQQCVVVAEESAGGEKRLVGYVVPSGSRVTDAVELRDHLRASLPDYMVPSAFVTLERLPLTPNGKIDRKALPKLSAHAAVAREHVAPRTSLEERLAAIFGELLALPKVSVKDNFFDLGGHSLLAVRLMNRIEQQFGHRLPLARLFASSTVELLAVDLSTWTAGEQHWDTLVPIQPRAGKPVLFLVHGAGGNVLLYRELAQALGPEISVYGFQSLGLDRKARPLSRIEDMAAHYLQELRAFQPRGPYHLAGYCMGGSVSYEMARLLSDQGDQVALIGLLDTYNLSVVKDKGSRADRLSFLRQKIGFHLDNLTQMPAKDAVGYLAEKLRMAQEAGRGKIAARLKGIISAVSGAVEEQGAERFIQEINHQAAWDFVPMPSALALTAFSPQKNYDFFSDPNMGWSQVVGEHVEVVDIKANPHAMLIEPHVREVAAELKRRILRGQG